MERRGEAKKNISPREKSNYILMLHSLGGGFFLTISYPSNCYPISFRYGLHDSSKSDHPLPSILIKKSILTWLLITKIKH